jgi:signal transduction histidine kinase
MKTKILFSVFFLLLSVSAFGQTDTVIDSLEKMLIILKADTAKVNCLNELSIEYRNIRDNETSMQYAESAFELATTLNYKKGIATSYGNFGIIFEEQSNYPEALKNHFAALQIREDIGDKQGMCNSYGNIGFAYELQFKNEEALENYFTALKISKEIGFQGGMDQNYHRIGNSYRLQGNYAESMKNFSAGLKICEEIGDHQRVAYYYGEIGLTYSYQGHYPKALENLSASLKISEEIGDKPGQAISYINISSVNGVQGNLAEALKNTFAALKIFEEIGDKRNMAYCYAQIGTNYCYQGTCTEALKYYHEALRIRKEIGNMADLANTYHNIGLIYAVLDDAEKALENHLLALQIRDKIGDIAGLASSYILAGRAYEKQGNYTDALENHYEALKIYEDIGSKKDLADSYQRIGNIYKNMGNNEEALESYLVASKICKEIEDKVGFTSAYDNYNQLISLSFELNNLQDVRKYLNEALSLSKTMGTKEETAFAYRRLSQLDSDEANFEQALEHYKMYTLYKDSLYNEESNDLMARVKIQYETEKKDQEIELLNKDNEIKALELQQQEASLLASRLDAEKKQNELLQLNYDNERQKLELAESQNELAQQQAEASIQAADLDLANADRMLKEEQLEKQKILRNGMFAGVFLVILVGLLLFRSFRLRKKLEKQEAIVQERHRISADLHDDVGSGLSKITLLSGLLKAQAKTPENRKEAEKISETALELSSTISEIIWALNSNNDYLDNMVAYIRRYAAEYFEDSPVKLNITTPDNLRSTPINGDQRRNIFYSVKEALHNILKHAQATEAELRFALVNNELDVIISDNGKGIPDLKTNRFGHGIENMQARMKSISGDFRIEGHPGTRIFLKSAI